MHLYKFELFFCLHFIIANSKMESPNNKYAQKVKSRSQSPVSPASKAVVRQLSPLKALRNNSGAKDEREKYMPKENTKPVDFKLHTQERAMRRAVFNYTVATKICIMERQKRQVEKLLKTIEDEEVKLLRKEMIPRAQLMPYFDKPFSPQRSTRAPTVPREPSFKTVDGKCSAASA